MGELSLTSQQMRVLSDLIEQDQIQHYDRRTWAEALRAHARCIEREQQAGRHGFHPQPKTKHTKKLPGRMPDLRRFTDEQIRNQAGPPPWDIMQEGS